MPFSFSSVPRLDVATTQGRDPPKTVPISHTDTSEDGSKSGDNELLVNALTVADCPESGQLELTSAGVRKDGLDYSSLIPILWGKLLHIM